MEPESRLSRFIIEPEAPLTVLSPALDLTIVEDQQVLTVLISNFDGYDKQRLLPQPSLGSPEQTFQRYIGFFSSFFLFLFIVL